MDNLMTFLKDRLDKIQMATLLGAKDILTMEETSMFTGYSLKSLYAMTAGRTIPHFKKNGRLFFKKAELEDWMTSNPVKTQADIDSQASMYCVMNH